MLLSSKTYTEQALLAQYCRTGDESFISQVDNTRVKHYRRLVFNVVNDSINAAFPLAKNLVKQIEWESLIEEFYGNHACQSAQIWRMPKEFSNYIINSNNSILKKYSVFKDLLKFEWLEIELYMHADIECAYTEKGVLLQNKLVLNPEHFLAHFEYPIHLKKANKITKHDKGHYYLSIHRHPNNGKVLFTNLSTALVRLLEILKTAPFNIEELTHTLCAEFNLNNSMVIKENIINFIESSLSSKLILGYSLHNN